MSNGYGYFEYDYEAATGVPGLDFKPGSKLHDKILDEIQRRVKAANKLNQSVLDERKRVDWMLEGFMQESEFDVLRKQSDDRKPVTIVTPTMFIVNELIKAFMWQAFFSGNAITRYRGMGDSMAVVQAALMERINMVQANQFKERLKIMSMIEDNNKYGKGACLLSWKKLTAPKLRNETLDPLTALQLQMRGVKAASGDQVRYFTENQVYAEGTELRNIDQYQSFYDTNVPPERIQDGEHFGFIYRDTVFTLLAEENDPERFMFNAKYVRELVRAGSGLSANWNKETGRGDRYGGQLDENASETNGVHVTHFLWKLIPSEWNLGDSKSPEVWEFAIAGDCIIIKAKKLEEQHGKLPVIGCAVNTDGHSASPIGHLLTILNIQKFDNWLHKSIADASCTILNGIIFYDQARVDAKRLMSPMHGMLVPMKNEALGDNSGPPVHYFSPPNPTVGHAGISEKLQHSAMMGLDGEFNQLPERPGVAGIQAAQGRATGRLGLLASLIDEQAMRDLGHIKAYNTMQYMQEDVYVPLVGNYEEELRQAYGIMSPQSMIPVSPWDLKDFAFQVMPYTDQTSGMSDLPAMSEVVKMLMATPQAQQEVGQVLNLPNLVMQYFKKAGFTDIESLRRYVGGGNVQIGMQTMPEDQIMQEVDKGNLIPAGAAR